MATSELGFINVPISPTFVGIAGKLQSQLIKPARDAGKKAAGEVEKSVQDTVKSLERQVQASTGKLKALDQAYEDSASKRESQQHKLNAAIAEQTAAEEKYQQALKQGTSGTSELAKLEKAKAKVTDETIKMTKAERDVRDAEKKHKDQLDDLQRTTGKYEQAQSDLNNEVGKSKGVFGGLRDSMSGLGDQVSDMGGPIGNIGDTLSSFKGGPVAGVLAVAGAVGTAGAAFGKWNEDLVQSRVTMQNQFGLSADAARDMQGEVAEALGSGLGNYEETSLAVQQISQVLGDEVAHMGGMTAAQLADDFMAFNQTFERSAEETASTVDVMLNSGLVSSAQEGIDLLTAGMQKVPAAMQDEVFDAMNEYSKNFANLGITGEEAMSMLASAAENGQYAIDKTGDSIKEFSVLAIDPAKAEVFQEIGLNAEDMATAVAGGGDSAQQALQDTAQALLDIEDPGARAAKAVELFGAPIEDLGVDQIPGFLESLTAGSDGLGDFAGSAQEMADNTQRTFTGMMSSLKGRVQGWAIDTTLALNEWAGEVGSAIMDSNFVSMVTGGFTRAWDFIVSGLGWAKDAVLAGWSAATEPFQRAYERITAPIARAFTSAKETATAAWDELKSSFNGGDWGYGAIASLIGADNAQWVVDRVASVLPAWDEIVSALTGGDWGYGALSTLIGEEGAQELVDMLAEIGERVRDFRDRTVEAFHGIRDAAEPIVSWLVDFFTGQMVGALTSLGDSLSSVAGAFGSVASAVGGVLWEALTGAYELFRSLWDMLSPLLLPILKTIAAVAGGVLVGAFLAVVGAVRFAAEAIELLAAGGSWLIDHTLVPMIGAVGSVIDWFRDGSIAADVLKGVLIGLGGAILASMIPALVRVAAQWAVTAGQAVLSAGRQVAAWAMTSAAAVKNGVLATGNLVRMGAAWLAASAQATASAVKMAAAWVIGLGPVGWAIGAIVGIGAALTAFFTQTETGRELWSSLTSALASGWDWVVEKVGGGIEWLKGAWSSLGDGLIAVYEGFIKPVFDAFVLAGQYLVAIIGTAVLAPIMLGWQLLSAAFQLYWENYLQPVLQAFAAAGLWLWENALSPAFTWIGEGFTLLGETLSAGWLWIDENVFSLFRAGAQWLSDAFAVAVDWVSTKWSEGQELLHLGWLWIDSVVFAPFRAGAQWLSDAFAAAVAWITGKWSEGQALLHAGWLWIDANVFSVFRAGADLVSAGFSAAVQWISDRWSQAQGLLHAGWVWIDQNVFAPLGRGLDIVQGWFQAAVDGIGRIWDGLRSAAAKPVRFVVDAVWNNGILKAWNAIAKFLPGIDEKDPVPLGELGNYATGGVLPGWSPGRDIHDFYSPTGGVIHLSGGEAIMRPEWTQAVGGPEAVEVMNRAARSGQLDPRQLQTGFAHAFANGGVWDLGGFSSGGVLITTAIQSAMRDIVKAKYPDITLTSATRPGHSGYHGTGQATDWSNGTGNTPMQLALAHDIAQTYPGSAQLIYAAPGWAGNIYEGGPAGAMDSGIYKTAQAGRHDNHVHWAMTQAPNIQFGGGVFEGGNNGGGLGAAVVNWVADKARGLWAEIVDPIKSAIGAKMADFGDSDFAKIPGEMFNSFKDAAWSKISSLFGRGGGSDSGSVDVSDITGPVVDQVEAVFARHGFTGAEWEAAKWIIQRESNWNPQAVNPSSGAYGLFQFNPMGGDTLSAYLPDRNPDPAVQADAGARYMKDRYGSPSAAQAFWQQNGWYADGGVIPQLFTRDLGGIVPSGALVRNTSGRDELMLPPETTALFNRFLDEFPEVAQALESGMVALEGAAEALEAASDFHSVEGVTARQSARRVLDLGIDLPGASVVSGFLDAEEALWASRSRQLGHLDVLTEKEEALEDARKALAELESAEGGLSTDEQRKLDDAKAAVEESKADQAKADSDEKRAAAADKLADAEEKLARVREDLDESATKNAEKHAEDITKANDAVAKAEADLVEAKKQQVMDLDHITLVTQDSIMGMIPQVEGLASQILDMGVPAGLVAQGLGSVTGALTSVAGMAGPAGITLGMAFDAVKIGIQLVETIVGVVEEIIEKIHAARMGALQALADGWAVIADYASLVVDMQANVSQLQQEIVRGLNDQRAAEFALRVAQQDRMVAEAEGVLALAEARMALDKEIERGNIAAQLRLMGLHEDWDSYLSFQALAANGMLTEWSDAAIGALFTYEAARAKALQGELSARVEQINAEAELAAVTRENARRQADLLTAQERLIKMSAEVAGIDLVGAEAGSQMADLLVEITELQQKNESNLLGRGTQFADSLVGWIPGVNISSPWSEEMEGNQARIDANRQLIKQIGAEYGINITNAQIDAALRDMAAVSFTGGDPSAVLRSHFAEFAAAEDAKRREEAYRPIWDAEDTLADLDRAEEDFLADRDLFDKVQPLEETIKGLDYTIQSLEQSAQAWAEGNEDLRGEYLWAARAKTDAARELGIDWQLDGRYATPAVRDQIQREVTINWNGPGSEEDIQKMVDEILAGSDTRGTVKKTSTTVANARRGVSV